ncbi:hypothetical protein FA15DRAFT_323334 [Coprinopsis marcescibilis]|uniref:Uncharacterized protein n=1 Tax=Coprinopsis marcescibilis TaxID=230819 RepID=A0A5C3KZJ5_COPMA|nr:hypothetical protein FA15DRAFT_323334 [Coprinopsis marcescibilis]
MVMSRDRIPIYTVSQPQTTKGISRPNAEQLSISLAPLVTQRSLLFRVQTELGDKESYAALSAVSTASEESFWTLSAKSASVSGHGHEAGTPSLATGVSFASVYSQESFQERLIPIIASSAPIPRRTNPGIHADPRRYAIAFSPTMEWEKIGSMLSPSEMGLDFATQPHSFSLTENNMSAEPVSSDPPRRVIIFTRPETNKEDVTADSASTDSPRKRIRKDSTSNVISLSRQLSKRASVKTTKVVSTMLSRLSLDPSQSKATTRSPQQRDKKRPPSLRHLPPIQFSPSPIVLPSFADSAEPTTSTSAPPSAQPLVPPPELTSANALVDWPTDNFDAPRSKHDAMQRIKTLREEAQSKSPGISPHSPRKSARTKTHRRYASSPSLSQFNQRDMDIPPPLPSGSKYLSQFTIPPVPKWKIPHN